MRLAPARFVRLVPLALAACGSSASPAPASKSPSNDAAAAQDATAVVNDAATTGDADAADGQGEECAINASGDFLEMIGGVVAAMREGGNADSGALVIPTLAARDAFAAQVVAILGGNEGAACSLPSPYRLLRLSDPRAGVLRVVAELDATGAPAPSLYWGTYAAPAVAPAHGRLLAVEAPHPIFDTNTEIQAADTFVQALASDYLLAGAHRCADSAASGCTGTTDACGATANYRISDAAHTPALPFDAIHTALSSANPQLLFLQLHGNGEPCPDALVSDGSGSWNDAGLAATLAAALVVESVSVGECGAGYPTSTCDLCGTDNVQARETAGSTNACTTAAPSVSDYGRLVHVEQQLALRQTPDGGAAGYQPLIAAVLAAFPTE